MTNDLTKLRQLLTEALKELERIEEFEAAAKIAQALVEIDQVEPPRFSSLQ